MNHTFTCSDETVVETRAGRLRGFLSDGIYKFYGVKYADARRFQSPAEVQPWDGVKEAYGYGFVSPMLTQDTPGAGEMRCPHRYWPQDENCQYLNVWTQSTDPEKKNPVMVWLHGGGYSAGSSIEQAAYDGTNLAKYGGVVVVTLNHRLNILGYLDLSPYGEKYRNSANAGSEDIVAALRWVRDNIAGFGGDPDNVTLFGQSGGGEKIRMLMQCPDAYGLFHKGIIQSGVVEGEKKGSSPKISTGNYIEPRDSRPIVEALLSELGFDTADELEDVPYARLAEAYNKVSPALKAAGEYIGGGPMVNDFYLGDALEMGFTEFGKSVPIMIGSVLNEFGGFRPTSNAEIARDARAVIAGKYGEKSADEMIALFHRAFPGKSLRDLADMDDIFRYPSMKFIERRTETKMAPTYSYMLTFDFDINGECGPWHCSDIPFVFHNAATTPFCNIPGGELLEERMFSAWVSFAKYGRPGHAALPEWPQCAAGDEACMIFDRDCEVRHNHDHELIALYRNCENAEAAGNPAETVKIEH